MDTVSRCQQKKEQLKLQHMVRLIVSYLDKHLAIIERLICRVIEMYLAGIHTYTQVVPH